jgi:hypothetical protein
MPNNIFSPENLAKYSAINVEPNTDPNTDNTIPNQQRRRMNPLMMAGIMGANAFDGVTGRQALNSGGREMNPMLPQNPNLNLAAKVGIGGVLSAGLNRLHNNHPMLANGLSAASMAIPTMAGIHNINELRKNRQ